MCSSEGSLMRLSAMLAPLFLLLSLASCGRPDLEPPVVAAIPNPAGPGGAEPNLAAGADGRLYLSWVEPTGDGGHALMVSLREDDDWSAPHSVAAGEDWFVNWADFPSVAARADGSLVAHWLQKSGPATFAYDVRVALSGDGGRTWSESLVPHRDGTETEHGFVTLLPLADRFGLVWLDGRRTGGGHGEPTAGDAPEVNAYDAGGPMTLRFALVDQEGRLSREIELDSRVCDCCGTDVVVLPGGELVVAYRDRSEREVRDISVVRFDGEAWSDPAPVHGDGWRIAGCPVNGPALAVADGRLACAWFTAAEPLGGRVLVAFSEDGGLTFAPPARVDGGQPVGRVDLAGSTDGSILVSWLEVDGEEANIQVRRVASDGQMGPSRAVAGTSAERASGFPRLAVHGDTFFLAWTEAGEPSRVRTAVLR